MPSRRQRAKKASEAALTKVAPDLVAKLELLRAKRFDFAFLDENYASSVHSDVDEEAAQLLGTDVSRIFRAQRPGDPIVIIGCTGNAGTAAHDELARSSGQQATWGKPLPADPTLQLTRLRAEQLGSGLLQPLV